MSGGGQCALIQLIISLRQITENIELLSYHSSKKLTDASFPFTLTYLTWIFQHLGFAPRTKPRNKIRVQRSYWERIERAGRVRISMGARRVDDLYSELRWRNAAQTCRMSTHGRWHGCTKQLLQPGNKTCRKRADLQLGTMPGLVSAFL